MVVQRTEHVTSGMERTGAGCATRSPTRSGLPPGRAPASSWVRPDERAMRSDGAFCVRFACRIVARCRTSSLSRLPVARSSLFWRRNLPEMGGTVCRAPVGIVAWFVIGEHRLAVLHIAVEQGHDQVGPWRRTTPLAAAAAEPLRSVSPDTFVSASLFPSCQRFQNFCTTRGNTTACTLSRSIAAPLGESPDPTGRTEMRCPGEAIMSH